MTGPQTEQLLLSFPGDPRFLGALFPEYPAINVCLGDQLRVGLFKPSLLWDLAQSYAQFRQALPEVDLPADLTRAHRYLIDPDPGDHPMALAHMLHLPDNLPEGDLIHAALIGEDLTLEQVAEIFDYPVEVIRLVDQVFFNFRDRRGETMYVTQLFEALGAGGAGDRPRRQLIDCA